MAILYLVRHAQTEPVSGVAACSWPLSARGRAQALAVARLGFWADIGRVYSSPEEKAVATVRPSLGRYGLSLTVLNGLRELVRPSGAQMTPAAYSEAVAACFASPDESVSGWEPAGEAQRRIVEAIDYAAREAARPGPSDASGPVAVVSHGLALALYLAALAGRPAPTIEEWRAIPSPGWAVVDSARKCLVQPFLPV